MPGKQMAIDAELRSGSIDGTEARARRATLARESQFYGAMDGAMKFVKGDVIASLLIALINVLGGLAIGILQKDMAPVAALKRYGLLTIGDGLVTQIPALLIATAAGVLVTRLSCLGNRKR
jgi:type III secretory pathway component EscV